jgi:hypothetical protein
MARRTSGALPTATVRRIALGGVMAALLLLTLNVRQAHATPFAWSGHVTYKSHELYKPQNQTNDMRWQSAFPGHGTVALQSPYTYETLQEPNYTVDEPAYKLVNPDTGCGGQPTTSVGSKFNPNSPATLLAFYQPENGYEGVLQAPPGNIGTKFETTNTFWTVDGQNQCVNEPYTLPFSWVAACPGTSTPDLHAVNLTHVTGECKYSYSDAEFLQEVTMTWDLHILPTADSDNDGVPDIEELETLHTNPINSDTDGDKFLDGKDACPTVSATKGSTNGCPTKKPEFTIIEQPATLIVEPGETGGPVAYETPIARGAEGPIVCSPPSGSTFGLGKSVVTCTAKNTFGSATAKVLIHVDTKVSGCKKEVGAVAAISGAQVLNPDETEYSPHCWHWSRPSRKVFAKTATVGECLKTKVGEEWAYDEARSAATVNGQPGHPAASDRTAITRCASNVSGSGAVYVAPSLWACGDTATVSCTSPIGGSAARMTGVNEHVVSGPAVLLELYNSGGNIPAFFTDWKGSWTSSYGGLVNMFRGSTTADRGDLEAVCEATPDQGHVGVYGGSGDTKVMSATERENRRLAIFAALDKCTTEP